MGFIFLIIGIAAGVWLLGTIAYGLGAILGVFSLFTHPVNGAPKRRKVRVETKDAYYYSKPPLSEYDARYQTRENKPPRRIEDL